MVNTKKMLKHTRKLVFKNKSEKRIKLKGGASRNATPRAGHTSFGLPSASPSASPLSRVPRPPARTPTPARAQSQRVRQILRPLSTVNAPVSSSPSTPNTLTLKKLSRVPLSGWSDPSQLPSSLSGSVNNLSQVRSSSASSARSASTARSASPARSASTTRSASPASSRNQSLNVSQDITSKIEQLKDAMTEFARITEDASKSIKTITERIQ